jgi:hypothetical protein
MKGKKERMIRIGKNLLTTGCGLGILMGDEIYRLQFACKLMVGTGVSATTPRSGRASSIPTSLFAKGAK